MNALLTKFALERLQKGRKNEPPSLQQIAEKILIVKILNIVENIDRKGSLLCYCHKFLDWPYTKKSVTLCESCRIRSSLSPYFFKEKAYKDLKYLIKTYVDILKRKELIIKHAVQENIFFQ